MPIQMLFPTYIYRGRLASRVSQKLNLNFTREIAQLEAMDQHGVEWSKSHYRGGYSSYSSFAQLHNMSPHFGELRDLLGPHVAAFAKGLNWDVRRRKLQMTTCWANSMGIASYHTLHLHPQSVISGVYYVNAPKGASVLKIEDPRMGLFMAAPPRRPTAPLNERPYFQIEPKPGDFVLFESWMRHEVPPHQGTKRRLSVSFNYEL